MNEVDTRHEAQSGPVATRLSLFCPGATTAQYAPDLLLEPTHLDVTLHVDLEQQCLVVDEVITVRCNIGSKGNAYSITLDGIGFQHLHASRVNSPVPLNSQPTTPRKESASQKQSLEMSRDSMPTNEKPHSSRGLFGFLRGSNEKGGGNVSPLRSSTLPAPTTFEPPPPPPTEDVRDSTSFYCTYDGRKITLSWVGPEAFQGGKAGVTEKVRLIYLVDKPVTGLNFTKPPTEVEIEMIEQQQKPLVMSTYKKNDKSEKRVHTSAPIARISPFHSSRPLLAYTDHETERARYWLATIDQPCVRPTSKFTFVIKAGLAALANGELLPTASLDTPIPQWPLSLFNPPITTPKAPSWPKTLFIWNNPYPTASYLACFAVGQLHYIEAIPPRHMQAHYQQEHSAAASSSSTHAHSGAGLLTTVAGGSGSSSSTSSGGPAHGHKRTLSSDSGKTALASSAGALATPSVATPSAPSSGTLSARSGSQRLPIISEMSEAVPSLSASIASAQIAAVGATEVFQPTASEAQALLKADLAHHQKTSKKREEADWILKDIPMRYYTPRNVPLTTVQLMLGRTPEIMKWLQARFALPFPYPVKYYQFVGPELPSAMENITLTTWGSDYLLNPVWALEYGHSTESINVHEMAHSYFGNSVGVKFWDHAWLKEGWANYTECLWQEDKYGPDALAYMLWRNGRLYMKECENLYTRPIVTNRYDSSWDLYDQHLYRGGSRRIHSLRCILGDEVFWPAVTDYLRTFSGRLVETDDFRKTLEKHSHRNLLPFFSQWIHAPGYPKITATYEYSPTRQQISITAKQTQVDEKRGIGLFAMTIPIDIAYAAPSHSSSVTSSNSTTMGATYGQPAHLSSSSKIKWLKTAIVFTESSAEAHMTINVPSPPLQIIFDKKQSWVFSLTMDPGFSVLRTMALHCWSVPHRIWAAQSLLERGSPQELEVVSEMLSHREQHWGVIADVAAALAKPHLAQFAAKILCKLLLAPLSHPAQHPRALMSIALALGQIQDPLIRTSIHQFLAIKKYSNICRIDDRQIRSISSWTSLSEAAEKSRKEHKRSASSATKDQGSSGNSGQTTDSMGSDSEDSDTGFVQVSVSSSTKKDDATVNLEITIPYKTHGRLMEALAAQGDVADEALIVEQAERTRYGWLGITRGSALMALAEYGTQSAFDYILDATRISEHQHLKARTSAVIALAHCVVRAKLNPPMLTRAVHTLHLLLHDSTYAVRFAAVHALFKLVPQMGPSSAADSLSQIHHIRKTLSNQDRMWLKRKRKLVRGEGKLHRQTSTSSKNAAAAASSQIAPPLGAPVSANINPITPPGPSMDEFLALKSEFNALKARVTQIEKSLEDSEGEGQ
jgi:hypothetical protein